MLTDPLCSIGRVIKVGSESVFLQKSQKFFRFSAYIHDKFTFELYNVKRMLIGTEVIAVADLGIQAL